MDEFLKASGTAGPLRIAITDPEQSEAKHLSLPQPFAVLGRDDRADVPLVHDAVSRRHAYLQVIAGRAFWVDTQSRTGVRQGGGLEKRGWLERGASIGIGPYRIDVGGAGATDLACPGPSTVPPDPFAPLPARHEGRPRPVFEVWNRTTRLSAWPMDCALALVGRSSGCTFQLADVSVSRFHCSLLNTPAGVWVVDLLGREGIRVNGTGVRCARLEEGDELRVGRFRIRLRQDTSPGPVARVSLAGVPMVPAGQARSGVPALMPVLASAQRPVPSSGPGEPAWLSPVEKSGRALTEQSAECTGLVGELLAALIRQFGQVQQQISVQLYQSLMMQQQLDDQLQQAISMAQTLGAVQQDQMALVRVELDEMRRLSHEVEGLHAELSRQPPAASDPKLVATDAALGPGAVAPARALGVTTPVVSDMTLPPDAAPGGASRGIGTPIAPEVSTEGRCVWDEATRPESLTFSPVSATDSPPTEAGQATADPEELSHGLFHSVLYQRITEIQHERLGRWQKILGLVTGH